jgi:hypothetical protein
MDLQVTAIKKSYFQSQHTLVCSSAIDMIWRLVSKGPETGFFICTLRRYEGH